MKVLTPIHILIMLNKWVLAHWSIHVQSYCLHAWCSRDDHKPRQRPSARSASRHYMLWLDITYLMEWTMWKTVSILDLTWRSGGLLRSWKSECRWAFLSHETWPQLFLKLYHANTSSTKTVFHSAIWNHCSVLMRRHNLIQKPWKLSKGNFWNRHLKG